MLPELHSVLELLERGFGPIRILVVGDLMLDRYIVGEVERISPEAPVPVLRHAERYERPGGAANVAMNLAGLGCQAILAGFWGADAEQGELVKLLEAAKVDTVGVVSSSLPTISKTRIVARTQQVLRLDIESREPFPQEEAARLAAPCGGPGAEGSRGDSVRLCEGCSECQSVRGGDPGGSVCRGSGTGGPEDEGLQQVLRCDDGVSKPERTLPGDWRAGCTQTAELLEAARGQLKEHDLQYLTVTMSEKGITNLGRDEEFHSPARAREVFDVSGAGDTVIATLAACLAAGLQMRTAVELANLAAGIVVGKVGTVPIAGHELMAALTPSTGITSVEKILDFDRVQRRVAEWRAAGETVVFTNGCFDLLHVGHITLLEDCRRFGSKLVLGLNSDGSVSRLKGPTRPIVGERERARGDGGAGVRGCGGFV